MSEYEFNEYADDFEGRRGQAKKSGTGCLLTGIGVGGLVIVLCCGGGTGLVMFGMNVTAREIEVELRDNQALVEQIGPLQSFEFNWTATFAADEDVYVFDARGEKGSGEVTVKSVTGLDDNEDVIWAEMRLPDGEVIKLVEE